MRSYRLTIDLVGPNLRDKAVVESDSLEGLVPTLATFGGVEFERYGDAEDFVEVRLDYVARRTLEAFDDDRTADGDVKAVTRFGPAALLREDPHE